MSTTKQTEQRWDGTGQRTGDSVDIAAQLPRMAPLGCNSIGLLGDDGSLLRTGQSQAWHLFQNSLGRHLALLCRWKSTCDSRKAVCFVQLAPLLGQAQECKSLFSVLSPASAHQITCTSTAKVLVRLEPKLLVFRRPAQTAHVAPVPGRRRGECGRTAERMGQLGHSGICPGQGPRSWRGEGQKGTQTPGQNQTCCSQGSCPGHKAQRRERLLQRVRLQPRPRAPAGQHGSTTRLPWALPKPASAPTATPPTASGAPRSAASKTQINPNTPREMQNSNEVPHHFLRCPDWKSCWDLHMEINP